MKTDSRQVSVDDDTFVVSGDVRRRYGGITAQCLGNWLRNEKLGFPQPLVINGRRFWRLTDLLDWEARCRN